MPITPHNIDDHIRSNFSKKRFEWSKDEWIALGEFCKLNGYTVEVVGTYHAPGWNHEPCANCPTKHDTA